MSAAGEARHQRVLAAFVLLAACKAPGLTDVPDAGSSPQASAVPAPLSTVSSVDASASFAGGADAGPPPSNQRADLAMPTDVVTFGKDSVFYTLSATVRGADMPPPARAPEINVALVEQAKKKNEARLTVDLGSGRMRVGFEGAAIPLPEGVELRARSDRYGHALVFAGGSRYRTLGPGTMRTFFGEGRYDAMPSLGSTVVTSGAMGWRLGMRTRSVEISTPLGRLSMELGRVADLGDAGGLVCRLLAEWVDASPTSAPCLDGELPLRAEVRWAGRGAVQFEVQRLTRRTDLGVAQLACPPAGATFSVYELPTALSRPFYSESELAQFHQIVDVPLDPTAPKGLLLVNHTDAMRLALVDGVPIAQVAPQSRLLVTGLARGHYQLQWRTFLDDAPELPLTVTVPGKSELGTPDTPAK
ncbi:MAG: hypothetical protein HOO96_23245 [Polyangiaceae bacterium]|nr:hypothetical protein [Polyangiaceae bacterium]